VRRQETSVRLWSGCTGRFASFARQRLGDRVLAGNVGIRLISVRGKTSTLLYPSSGAKEQLDTKTYNTCPGAPEPDDKARFTTHGLAMRAVRNSIYTLYAVHHGKRESIEVLVEACGKVPVLTWIGCAIASDPIGLNSVVPLPGGGFVATNFLERGANASAARSKMMAGENNGELWEWHTGKDWRKVPGSDAGVDPETLKITEIINQPNTESFASGTVAIPIGNDLWVGSFQGDRIAIFPASE
jgi:hypothetical protein